MKKIITKTTATSNIISPDFTVNLEGIDNE